MTTVSYTASNSWTAPSGVTSVDVQCWGPGGKGANGTHFSLAGAGGGGGEYAENTSVPVTPGNVYSFTVGSGGSGTATTFTGDSSTVTAHAGANASGTTAGAGGSGSTAPSHFSGGSGGAGFGGNDGGGGGGGSAGNAGGGGAGGAHGASGGAGGTAGTGGGAAGGSGGASSGSGSAGTAPGAGGGGGGSGVSGTTGGAGAAGQITLNYTAATAFPGSAALTGTGTITAAWRFTATAPLTGTGTITAAGAASTVTGAALSGAAAMTARGALTYVSAAALAGSGTLAGHTIGFASVTLTGAGTLTALRSAEYTAHLAGTGTASAGNLVLGYSALLSGAGTVTVARVLGVVTAAASRGAVTTPCARPGSSQVAVSPPGSSRLYWLGSLGQVTALTYSFVCPGGADKMTATVMVPASYRTQLFNPGWTVRIFRGGHQVWSGKLDEPQPTAQGWTLTATGTGNLGTNFVALYSGTWPSGQPDASVNAAIVRGLPWVNPGIGQPAGAWFGQAVDTGAQSITALLNLVCTRGGLTWYVNSQPGGTLGDDLTVFPLPAAVNRLLVVTTPVGRTLGGDINTIFLRYQITADTTDSSGNSTPATYGTTVVQNAQSVAAHGQMETYIDISDAGTISAGTAQTVGNYVLEIYQRASFAGPFTARYGDLMNAGGAAVDPGTDQAGNVVRLLLTDYAQGGEVVAGPITFIVGGYTWDDISETATIVPYQTLDSSLTGLLGLESTLLAPIAASS